MKKATVTKGHNGRITKTLIFYSEAGHLLSQLSQSPFFSINEHFVTHISLFVAARSDSFYFNVLKLIKLFLDSLLWSLIPNADKQNEI